MRTLDTWWSPAAECWRVEDRTMFTYYSLDHVIAHLKEREARARIPAPPHGEQTKRLFARLQASRIAVVFSEDK